MAKRVILHATDFSPASRSAFARAIELTKGTNGQLLVLHVLNPMVPVIGARPIEPPTYARLQQASRAWALKHLGRLTGRPRPPEPGPRPSLSKGQKPARSRGWPDRDVHG
jgi:nucleotide-binding universal stress UspA family protein